MLFMTALGVITTVSITSLIIGFNDDIKTFLGIRRVDYLVFGLVSWVIPIFLIPIFLHYDSVDNGKDNQG